MHLLLLVLASSTSEPGGCQLLCTLSDRQIIGIGDLLEHLHAISLEPNHFARQLTSLPLSMNKEACRRPQINGTRTIDLENLTNEARFQILFNFPILRTIRIKNQETVHYHPHHHFFPPFCLLLSASPPTKHHHPRSRRGHLGLLCHPVDNYLIKKC